MGKLCKNTLKECFPVKGITGTLSWECAGRAPGTAQRQVWSEWSVDDSSRIQPSRQGWVAPGFAGPGRALGEWKGKILEGLEESDVIY